MECLHFLSTVSLLFFKGDGGGGCCKYRDIKCSGDLEQVVFVPLFVAFHLEDEESIKKAMKYSDNLG